MKFSFLTLRAEAESISLQQDVSKGWLVLRFCSSSSALAQREGAIGARHLPTEAGHLHARALKDSTEQILKDLAVPVHSMPYAPKTKKVVPREQYRKLLNVMLPKIEMVTADGASDEQLTLQLLLDGQLSNLLLTCRDLAHCARRIASRSSFADEYLKKV